MKELCKIMRMDDLGRVVVPMVVRNAIGIKCGEPLEVHYDENGVYFKKVTPRNVYVVVDANDKIYEVCESYEIASEVIKEMRSYKDCDDGLEIKTKKLRNYR